MKQSDSLASDGAENTLIIRILRGENFESVFEDELPSCYCLYTFYIYQNQEQFEIVFWPAEVFFIREGLSRFRTGHFSECFMKNDQLEIRIHL